MHLLHYCASMPTLYRFDNCVVRVNVPDHRPPHVHVVTTDRRDALVDLATLAVTSRSVRTAEIADALAWIAANCAHAKKVFEDCNP